MRRYGLPKQASGEERAAGAGTCMHAAWHQSSGSVVGLSAPPVTGQRQHCGSRPPSSCAQPAPAA